MGYLYFEKKSHDDALVCFNRALNIYKVVFGEKDDRIPSILNKYNQILIFNFFRKIIKTHT